jgi:transposase-like protein
VQRCTGASGQSAESAASSPGQALLAHAPRRLHDEPTGDRREMIYAETAAEVEARRKAFVRKWRLKCRAVADSLEGEGGPWPRCGRVSPPNGERLSTPDRVRGRLLTRLPPGQWKSARTTDAIERPHEEFRRRIRTRTVLPEAETAPMPFWAPLASGQITMRKLDGRESLSAPLADQAIDLAP